MFSVFIFLGSVALLSLSQAHVPTRFYLPPAAGESFATPAPIITKQFYSVSAAEDSEELQPRTKHLLIGRAMRNYRVIFIRAPSAQSEAVKYTAELAPQEERTLIYVLSRKQPELEAHDIQTPRQHQQSSSDKPEVFFIRYKTNEEAAAAQREIQTQYDQLGGNTELAAPYVAPVQSVIGALDAAKQVAATDGYDYQRPTARFL
ncbi:LOW QUALITY PROTEIN: uncharacterized protein Dvir_GJ19307 [Drosophila virilis]|uniref:DUF243 domain-containing protein n=1 Tax=Drosophila virilis TaxID=7244 RepID=B4M1H7_DROVI|nr:LOW QUALITY PROTEIN: uncharacterized protein Dvir_GJ19307 [Drosophila virilis]